MIRSAARRGAVRAIVTFVLTVMMATPLVAQRGPDGRRGGGRQDRAALEQRFRAQMARVIQERLGLTEGESEQLSSVARSFDERRAALARSEQATRRRVEALMLEGGDDEVEAAELLARMVELRQEEGVLFQEEQAALLAVLSPVQVLQLQSLREQFGQRIRSLRRGNDRERRGGGDQRRGRGAPGVRPDTLGVPPGIYE